MITSVTNSVVKNLTKLQLKKYRMLTQQMIVESKHLVDAAHAYGSVLAVYATVPFEAYPNAIILSEHVMKKITNTKTPPTIIALCEIPQNTDIHARVLCLENIQDPGNVGTILRSALAFGFKTVILDQCADPYSPKVLRSTQGTIFKLSLMFMSIEQFSQNHPNYQMIATSKEPVLNQVIPSPPLALMLGNEGSGLSPKSLALSDHQLWIQTAEVDSLNVAIAGAILMHQLSPFSRIDGFEG